MIANNSDINDQKNSSNCTLEILLILITLGLMALLYKVSGLKVTVLNLFYLPVVLAGFFLGRYRAGILAFFCAVSASTLVVMDLDNYATFTSPIEAMLAVMIWSAVLGLTGLLVGTLNDERIAKMAEAHEAHVAIVEVLSRYLQGTNPELRNRATRRLHLSEKVARKIKLDESEIDDLRIASMLMDIENIEITSRVIKKAVGTLEVEGDRYTIAGTELVQSLSSVLTGAFPLVLNREDAEEIIDEEIPFAARILQTVGAFDELLHDQWNATHSAQQAIQEMENDPEANHHPAVFHALQEVLKSEEATSGDPMEELEALLLEDP